MRPPSTTPGHPLDEGEFRALVERHAPGLLALARRMLGDQSSAEAITQDAFVRLAEAGSRLRHPDAVTGWLYRVTVNLCRDERRRRQRAKRLLPLELVKDSLPTLEADNAEDGPDDHEALWRSIDQLPPKLREILVLRFVSGLSYAELANVLEVSTGTVASRLFRALRRLGSLLSHPQRNAR